MKKAVFIIIAFASLTISCNSLRRNVKNAFTHCYKGIYTGLDTLINLEGYYSSPSLIFYDNGLVIRPIAKDAVQLNRNDFSLLQEVAESQETKFSKYHMYNFIDCGSYRICGDTIKVQMIHKSYSINDYWRGRESWYKIIDRNTLLFISDYVLTTNQKEKDFQEKSYPFIGGTKRTFVSVPALPSPDYFWILKEKWFWCNEEDWKSYMESSGLLDKNKK